MLLLVLVRDRNTWTLLDRKRWIYSTGWATITDSVGKKKFYIKFSRLWIVPISVCFIDIIDSWYTFQI
jgi:hypothetical protein